MKINFQSSLKQYSFLIVLCLILTKVTFAQFGNLTREVGSKGYLDDRIIYGKTSEGKFLLYKLNKDLEVLDSVQIDDKLLEKNYCEVFYSPIGIEIVIRKNQKKYLGSFFLDNNLNLREKTSTDEYIRYFEVSQHSSSNGKTILILEDHSIGMPEYIVEYMEESNPFTYQFKYRGASSILVFSHDDKSVKLDKKLELDNKITPVRCVSQLKNSEIRILASKKEELIQLNLNTENYQIEESLIQSKFKSPATSSYFYYWDRTDQFFLLQITKLKEDAYEYIEKLSILKEDGSLEIISETESISLDLHKSATITPIVFPKITKTGLFLVSKYDEYKVVNSKSFIQTHGITETKIGENNSVSAETFVVEDAKPDFSQEEVKNLDLTKYSAFPSQFYIHNNKIYHLAKDRYFSKITGKNQDLIIINFNDKTIDRRNWWKGDLFPLSTIGENIYYPLIGASGDYSSEIIQSFDGSKLLILKYVDRINKSFPIPVFKVELINTEDF